MNTKVEIVPKSCGPLGTASLVAIMVQSFNIADTSCGVLVSFYTAENKPISNMMLNMSGSVYQNWGEDNTYVKTWVYGLLGLQDKQ